MQKIGQGRRGEVFLYEKDGKKICRKQAVDYEKKFCLQKEVQIISKLNTAGINFVPQIINFGDDFFEYYFIPGNAFDKIFEKSDPKQKTKLILNLLDRIYKLDRLGVIHGEMIRPFDNILVDDNLNINIIDFERGNFGDFSGKNMRSFAQWLKSKNYLTIQDLKNMAKIKQLDDLYKFTKNKIQMKTNFVLDILYILFVVGGLLALDLMTKYMFVDVKIFEYLWIFTPVLNKGISWGIYINPIVVIGITLLAVFGMIYLYCKKYINLRSFVFILGGSLGNLYDRILVGGVRDFIDFHFFPIFNFADAFLTIGFFLILFNELKHNKG